MRNIKRVLLALTIATMGYAGPAQAVPITVSEGGSFTIDWACSPADCDGYALTAAGVFTVTDISDGSMTLQASISNTWSSLSTVLFLTGIGFNIDPNATGVASSIGGAYLRYFQLNQTFPGFQTLEICADSQSNGSCGAGNNGIPEGMGDSFTLTLLGGFTQGGSVTFSDFAVKFAGDPGSYEFGERVSVPEPTSLMFLGLGLLGVAAFARRH